MNGGFMKYFAAVATLLVLSGLCFAQSSDARKGWGYVVGGAVAPKESSEPTLFNVAGGGEWLLNKGLAVSSELGYIGSNGGSGAGLFSGNLSYHFGGSDANRRLVPFVTGGYSLGFREFAVSGGNFGGGVQYWMNKHVGLRFEVRDYIFSSDRPNTVAFRGGISFR
jgi:hypothetical protein